MCGPPHVLVLDARADAVAGSVQVVYTRLIRCERREGV